MEERLLPKRNANEEWHIENRKNFVVHFGKFADFYREFIALEEKYGVTVNSTRDGELFLDGGEDGDYTFDELSELVDGESY